MRFMAESKERQSSISSLTKAMLVLVQDPKSAIIFIRMKHKSVVDFLLDISTQVKHQFLKHSYHHFNGNKSV